jgi:hypothetical protein
MFGNALRTGSSGSNNAHGGQARLRIGHAVNPVVIPRLEASYLGRLE